MRDEYRKLVQMVSNWGSVVELQDLSKRCLGRVMVINKKKNSQQSESFWSVAKKLSPGDAIQVRCPTFAFKLVTIVAVQPRAYRIWVRNGGGNEAYISKETMGEPGFELHLVDKSMALSNTSIDD